MYKKGLAKIFKLKEHYPFYLANVPTLSQSQSTLSVTNKYTHETITRVSLADEKEIQKAIEQGTECCVKMRKLPAFERKGILASIIKMLKMRSEELAYVLCLEAGKPISDAKGEVNRCIETFEIAAEESTRIYGEYTPFDISESHKGYEGIQKRFPIGLISMISPFNFPLNLVAHKVAPAIASGCPFVLKPSSLTPIGALILGEIMSKTALPPGAFSIIPCESKNADSIITDERIKMLSFTGSPNVGWHLKNKSGKKKVILELGSNAACVVDHNVNIEHTIDRVIFGAFYQSGQSCISVQRLYVHSDIYEEFKEKFIRRVSLLKKGDPLDEETFIGPLISLKEAQRCSDWVEEAVRKGGKILVGGSHDKNLFDATVVENVPKDCHLINREVFGPICTLDKFFDFKEVISKVNNSKFGLQAGVFTKDINKAFYAYENLEVGGVVINDVPSKRIDSMPYGGVKDSGVGKEGVRNSIKNMTEVKLLLLRNIGCLD